VFARPDGFLPAGGMADHQVPESRGTRRTALRLARRQPSLSEGGGVDVVERGDHEIGTGRGEQVGVVGPGDPDRGHAAGFRGLDFGGRVLDHDRVARLDAELVRRGQEDLGVGLRVVSADGLAGVQLM
jgi:hypothetical protein